MLKVLERAPDDRRGPPGIVAKGKPVVMWFRNDLRLHDNESLNAALESASSVFPLYIFDPRHFQKSRCGIERTGPFKAHFILECVQDLRRRLEEVGSKLFVRIGRPEEIIPAVVRRLGAKDVYCQEESMRPDIQVQQSVTDALEDVGARLRSIWGSTLHRIEELPFALEQMPSNFSSFHKRLEAVAVQTPAEAPENLKKAPSTNLEEGKIPTLKDLGFSDEASSNVTANWNSESHRSPGGESKALEQLKKITSSSRYAMSRLSSHLSAGCLSPRLLYHTLKNACQSDTVSNRGKRKKGSRNECLTELLWHDFYRFSFRKEGTESGAQRIPAVEFCCEAC